MQQCSSLDASGRHADPQQATGPATRSDFVGSAPNAISWAGPGELPQGDIYEISTQAFDLELGEAQI
jgi:hypothetical protein